MAPPPSSSTARSWRRSTASCSRSSASPSDSACRRCNPRRATDVLRRGAAIAASASLLLALTLPARGLDAGYESEIQSWRSARESRLRSADGWLTVAGLFWLKQGTNRFGSAADNEIVLPEGSAPARAGVFEHHGTTTTLRLEPGVAATVKDAPVTTLELHPDTAGEPDVVRLGRLSLHVIERGGRYAIRLKDSQ